MPSLTVAISLVACALDLPVLREGDKPLRMQWLPCGQFWPVDGRKAGVSDAGYGFVDAAVAVQVIVRAQGRATRICIDYDHQTLHGEATGKRRLCRCVDRSGHTPSVRVADHRWQTLIRGLVWPGSRRVTPRRRLSSVLRRLCRAWVVSCRVACNVAATLRLGPALAGR
jgi:hypothetical protein